MMKHSLATLIRDGACMQGHGTWSRLFGQRELTIIEAMQELKTFEREYFGHVSWMMDVDIEHSTFAWQGVSLDKAVRLTASIDTLLQYTTEIVERNREALDAYADEFDLMSSDCDSVLCRLERWYKWLHEVMERPVLTYLDLAWTISSLMLRLRKVERRLSCVGATAIDVVCVREEVYNLLELTLTEDDDDAN